MRDLPKVITEGTWKIKGLELPCVTLDDGTRLITEEGMKMFLKSIGADK